MPGSSRSFLGGAIPFFARGILLGPDMERSAQLTQDGERRLAQRAARPQPASYGDAGGRAGDPEGPQAEIPAERNLEHAIGEHVPDRGRTRRREQSRESSEREKLGDLRGRELPLTRAQRAQHGRVEATL